MSLLVIVVCALAGFVAGSVIWTLARNQATRRSLADSPRCESDLSISFSNKPQASGEEPSASAAACGEPLSNLAWLPLFGLGTAYRCPRCGTRQSHWRAVFELVTVFYFVLAAARIDDGLTLVSVLLFSLPLLLILLVDTWTRLIYTNVIYLGVIAGLVFAVIDDGLDGLARAGLAMVVALFIFLIFFALARVMYRGVSVVPFGRGDIYLAVMIAAMVRLDDIVRALFLGIVFAAIGGVLLIVSKQVTRRQAMPYGPFLCLGALLTLIW